MKHTSFIIPLCTALAFGAVSPAVAKGPSHDNNKAHKAQGCPSGLAKKNNGCLPPGQAKKQHIRQDDHAYDNHDRDNHSHDDHYHDDHSHPEYSNYIGNPVPDGYVRIATPQQYGLDPYGTYYRSGQQVYKVDADTMEVLAFVGLINQLLN